MTAADPPRHLARAKINLTLHITGQRGDGYHLLDSLVVFADVGDIVTATPAHNWSLHVTGPFADGLEGPDNLMLHAARLTAGPPAALTLEKHLPVASGIGGGSADAAATLLALHAMDGRALPADTLVLGADVPVCGYGAATRMRGIGERLDPLPPLPPLHSVLVNPGVAVSTAAIFRALKIKNNPGMGCLPHWPDIDALAAWLTRQRNDMESPARAICPAIGIVLSRLAATNCLLARMSGSGATCFGLYPSAPEARDAATALATQHPDWWVRATILS